MGKKKKSKTTKKEQTAKSQKYLEITDLIEAH